MSEVPLFAGYSDASTQWRAERFQLVNWGGFHGHHAIDLAPGSTLVSGASGTGKSTLLDAYLALMMPSTVPFNGASNDATQGRARGEQQRNVLSYLRGKRDTAHDGERLTDRVMRGDGTEVWGAIALTFVDEMERRFTAARVYLAPAHAQRTTNVLMRLITVTDALDLRRLEEFVPRRFDPRALRAGIEGLTSFDAAARFIDAVTTRLGIGAGGGGERALRLLARIQAGQQVRTVDSLYKQMVLEEPPTFEVAARAVEQFTSLERAFAQLEEDAAQAAALEDIEQLHRDYVRAGERAEQLDRFGLGGSRSRGAAGGGTKPRGGAGGASSFERWVASREQAVLDAAESANRAEAHRVRETLLGAEETVAALRSELGEIQRRRHDEDGGAHEVLSSGVARARAHADRVAAARERFDALLTASAAPEDPEDGDAGEGGGTEAVPTSAKDLAALLRSREEFLAGRGDAEAAWRAERDELVSAEPALRKEAERLGAERTSLARREGRVPLVHDAARRAIAEAAGLSVAELPFAAELMDVAPEYAQWRPAAEATLRGVGLTLLMDVRKQRQVRQSIDQLSLPTRVRFEGVDLGEPGTAPADADMISGRLVFKDSPFTAWVMRRVSRPGTDHLCVEDPAELGGQTPKVTATGQTSRGRGGAHGRNQGEDVLGFSNEEQLERIDERLAAIAREVSGLQARRDGLEARMAASARRAEAAQAVLGATWEEIDVDAARAAAEQVQQELDALGEGSDVLSALAERERAAEQELDAAQRERARAQVRTEELDREWGTLVTAQDRVADQLQELEDAEEPSEADAAFLAERLREVDEAPTPTSFPRAVRALRTRLLEDSDREARAANQAAQALHAVFRGFNERWPDPDRGDGVESYPEFAAILARIEEEGLHLRREAFRRQVRTWSGNDLKLLHDAYDVAMADIEERLEPVNDILASLPFGPEADRLRIVVRRLAPQPLVQFRRRLRELASVDVGGEGQDAEAGFRSLRSFMTLLAGATAETASRRDEMLDVRRHLEITAVRVDEAGNELSVYSSLGGKSGGESQELVAFIVGSALRYQLGDETRTRPRYAPVFLDEGFVKSDAEFAGRAVAAWRGLGFQLIVSAPLDKVTALEPHMQLSLSVTKDQSTGYSYVTAFRDAEEAQEALPDVAGSAAAVAAASGPAS